MSAFALAVETAVAERQDDVGRDHEDIHNVENHHVVHVAEDDLCGQSKEIADNDKNLINDALALRGAGAERLGNIERP